VNVRPAPKLCRCIEAVRTLGQRICRWLLTCEDRIALTQEFLATMLGVQRTSVTAAAIDIQGRDVIQYSWGKITVIKRERFMKAACECHAQGELIYERIFPRAPATAAS
jgi:hypothetical protein